MSVVPTTLRLVTAAFLIVHFTVLDFAPALAGLAPSQVSGVTAISSERDADLVAVRRALENKLVAQKLADYGVDPASVETRLASLTDEEMHTLASATRGLPSGSDSLGVLVTVLVIVLLVILILKLLNREVVVR